MATQYDRFKKAANENLEFAAGDMSWNKEWLAIKHKVDKAKAQKQNDYSDYKKYK